MAGFWEFLANWSWHGEKMAELKKQTKLLEEQNKQLKAQNEALKSKSEDTPKDEPKKVEKAQKKISKLKAIANLFVILFSMGGLGALFSGDITGLFIFAGSVIWFPWTDGLLSKILEKYVQKIGMLPTKVLITFVCIVFVVLITGISNALAPSPVQQKASSVVLEPKCTPNWQCTEWSGCMDKKQTRTCADTNNCNTTAEKPAESQACCVENWNCTWGKCTRYGIQTEECTDVNNCGTSYTGAVETQACTPKNGDYVTLFVDELEIISKPSDNRYWIDKFKVDLSNEDRAESFGNLEVDIIISVNGQLVSRIENITILNSKLESRGNIYTTIWVDKPISSQKGDYTFTFKVHLPNYSNVTLEEYAYTDIYGKKEITIDWDITKGNTEKAADNTVLTLAAFEAVGKRSQITDLYTKDDSGTIFVTAITNPLITDASLRLLVRDLAEITHNRYPKSGIYVEAFEGTIKVAEAEYSPWSGTITEQLFR